MTWIEVASDAVKIGLGAVVGGVLGMLAAKQAHSIRKKEELSRRRRDQLEQLCAQFDEISRQAVSVIAATHTIKKLGDTDQAKEAMMREVGMTTLYSVKERMQWIDQLCGIEVRLKLIGLPKVGQEVEAYWRKLAELTSKPNSLTMSFEPLHDQKKKLIELMAEAYQAI